MSLIFPIKPNGNRVAPRMGTDADLDELPRDKEGPISNLHWHIETRDTGDRLGYSHVSPSAALYNPHRLLQSFPGL